MAIKTNNGLVRVIYSEWCEFGMKVTTGNPGREMFYENIPWKYGKHRGAVQNGLCILVDGCGNQRPQTRFPKLQ